MAAAVGTAYTVFGLTGFGAAMVALPILVQFAPLHFAVPLVLLLDAVSTTIVGLKNRAIVSRRELMRLGPFMFVGIAIGATALARLDSKWLLVGLGIFVIAIALRSLASPPHQESRLAGIWALPAGVIGGVFSALFGTGGPIYTLYLARRLPEVDVFRATISAVIFVSAVVRLGAFGMTGLMRQEGLFQSAVSVLPFCVGGVWAGSKLRARLSPIAVKRLLLVFLIAGGTGVILRGMA